MANNQRQTLLKFAIDNESQIRNWVKNRPSINRTYEDLIRDIKSKKLKLKQVPKDKWKEHWKNRPSLANRENIAGFYEKSTDTIHYPEGSNEIPHETLHYFSGHRPGSYNVPEINPYIKADMALKGWLPSFHPAGRRPTLPEGRLGMGKWWNENISTKQTEYSNNPTGAPVGEETPYHPWFDEHAYDQAHEWGKGDNKMAGFLDFMTDQKGVFQGGNQGRLFGRLRDAWGGDRNTAPPRTEDLTYKTTSTGEKLPESTINQNPNRRVAKDDWDLRAIQAQEAWDNKESDPEKAKKFNLMMANRLAKTFDPSSKQGVQALQTYMQRAGIKDYEGKEIKADAMFGERTESGLRQIQDLYERQNMGMSDYGFKNTPASSNTITGVEDYPNYPDFQMQNKINQTQDFIESEGADPSSGLSRFREGWY